jgi:hypothetical protein
MTYKVSILPENIFAVKSDPSSNYKTNISYFSENNYSVKSNPTLNYKTSLSYTLEIMPRYLTELMDVEIGGNNDRYVLMYDAATSKWRDRNPDEVLSAATTEPISPGLPADFENQLDVDLDDRIDLDAGVF